MLVRQRLPGVSPGACPEEEVGGAYLGQQAREGRASSQSRSLVFRLGGGFGQRGTWQI